MPTPNLRDAVARAKRLGAVVTPPCTRKPHLIFEHPFGHPRRMRVHSERRGAPLRLLGWLPGIERALRDLREAVDAMPGRDA